MAKTRSIYTNICFCIAFLPIFNLVYCIAYQTVQTACGQSVVFANGKYRYTCANGYIDDFGTCVPFSLPQCPAGYTLINSLCYLQSQLTTQLCPNGYYMHNGLCYPAAPIPCNAVATTEQPPMAATPEPTPQPTPEPTPQPTPAPITAPPPRLPEPIPEPPAEALTRCPPGSIFMHEKCRKLVCFEGEYHHGRCLQAACPVGTVWRGRRCQLPGYVTTILEIENIFTNEAHHRPGKIFQENINNVHTPKPTEPPTTTSTTYYRPAEIIRTTTQSPLSFNRDGCCTVITPRRCKLYGKKWVCFSKRSKRCDPKICQSPVIYLKVPEVIYNPPVLVVPPNPPLKVCKTPNCDGSDTVDCLGCINNRRESCSPYCYHYMCPQGACSYMDLEEYCINYPGEVGCTKEDGCSWDWCGEKDTLALQP